MSKKQSSPPAPKCVSCENGYDGSDGNRYQPCSCRPAPPPPPPIKSSALAGGNSIFDYEQLIDQYAIAALRAGCSQQQSKAKAYAYAIRKA